MRAEVSTALFPWERRSPSRRLRCSEARSRDAGSTLCTNRMWRPSARARPTSTASSALWSRWWSTRTTWCSPMRSIRKTERTSRPLMTSRPAWKPTRADVPRSWDLTGVFRNRSKSRSACESVSRSGAWPFPARARPGIRITARAGSGKPRSGASKSSRSSGISSMTTGWTAAVTRGKPGIRSTWCGPP